IGATGIDVISAVGSRDINVPVGISDEPVSGSPNSATKRIRRRQERCDLLQRLRVIGHDPSVLYTRPANVDAAVRQQQPGALNTGPRGEAHHAILAAAARSWNRGADIDGATKLFSPRRDVDRMKRLKELAAFLGSYHNVQSITGGIDNGCRGNASDGVDAAIFINIQVGAAQERRNSRCRIDEAHLPKRRGRKAVSVKS